jgi:hypothetical protein
VAAGKNTRVYLHLNGEYTVTAPRICPLNPPSAEEESRDRPPAGGVGSAVGLQLRVRFVPAALLAVLRTALSLRCVSEARDWTGHVVR